jgi:thioredoxin reductase (NADPH)
MTKETEQASTKEVHDVVVVGAGPAALSAAIYTTREDIGTVLYDVPGEQEFYARGVHYCATCDGAFYRDKRLVVVGGGNSAVQEATFLTRFATHIDLLVRGEKLRASEVLQHELEKHKDKITVHFNTTTDEIVGEDKFVTKVVGTDRLSGKKVEFPTDGVFIFVGLKPNTEFLQETSIELDEIGFVKTDNRMETTMKGVFAAGDVRSGATMQIASATGEGATTALMIREYLEGLGREHTLVSTSDLKPQMVEV